MDWLLKDIWSIWLNREIWLFYGGLITVSVTIFLVGALKALIGNKIQNKLVRKTVLSFVSVALVAPITAIYLALNTVNGFTYYWYIYAFNAVCTIVVYWFYENTHLRELLALIGRNTILKATKALFSKDEKAVPTAMQSIRNDAKKVIKSYSEDDLENL